MDKQKEIQELKKRIAKLETKCNEPDIKNDDWLCAVGYYSNELYVYNKEYDEVLIPDSVNRGTLNAQNVLESACLKHTERVATHEEVERALITEAKRRGFVKGATFEYHGPHSYYGKATGFFKYNSGHEALYVLNEENAKWGHSPVWRAGKWLTLPLKLTIGGHDVKFKDGFVEIGCTTFYNCDLLNFNGVFERALSHNIIDIDAADLKAYNKIIEKIKD